MKGVFDLKRELRGITDTQRAKNLQRFFKTGMGEYGEGDVFLGITVPKLREIAKKYYFLDIKQLEILIASKFHEERLIALFILTNKYKTTNHKKIIFHFYLKNIKWINNWDLVDLSAPNIVGEHLFNMESTHLLNGSLEPSGNTRITYGDKSNSPAVKASLIDTRGTLKNAFRKGSRPIDILIRLAKSENLWERRIAVLATFQFIKNNRFNESLELARILLNDKHDLIHKALGWMLREIGKRDLKTEVRFLNKYTKRMPRTMLRYAIERFPQSIRLSYLSKKA